MNADEEEKLKERTRDISIKEGSAYAVSDGFGIRNVTPYLLEVGRGASNVNFYVGLLSAVPSLLGNFVQLLSARLQERYSRKKIVSWSVFFRPLCGWR